MERMIRSLNNLLEEFLAQEKAFFYRMEEGEKLNGLLDKAHDSIMKNGKINGLRKIKLKISFYKVH